MHVTPTGHAVLPNSAPDSLTPKNLNLVRVPGQTLFPGEEAVVVVVPVVVVFTVVVVGDAVTVVELEGACPGRHWE